MDSRSKSLQYIKENIVKLSYEQLNEFYEYMLGLIEQQDTTEKSSNDGQ